MDWGLAQSREAGFKDNRLSLPPSSSCISSPFMYLDSSVIMLARWHSPVTLPEPPLMLDHRVIPPHPVNPFLRKGSTELPKFGRELGILLPARLTLTLGKCSHRVHHEQTGSWVHQCVPPCLASDLLLTLLPVCVWAWWYLLQLSNIQLGFH